MRRYAKIIMKDIKIGDTIYYRRHLLTGYYKVTVRAMNVSSIQIKYEDGTLGVLKSNDIWMGSILTKDKYFARELDKTLSKSK